MRKRRIVTDITFRNGRLVKMDFIPDRKRAVGLPLSIGENPCRWVLLRRKLYGKGAYV